MNIARALSLLSVIIGITSLTLSVVPTAGSTIQPALPTSLSGTQEILLPPCNGQSVNPCEVNATWSASLLSPSQAGAWYVAVWGETGSFTTCGLIAVYSTNAGDPNVLPQPSGGSADYTFYNGVQYMSPALSGYSGTGITDYVHYSSADGCGTYNGPNPTTTATRTTTSTTKASSSYSATTTTTAVTSTTQTSTVIAVSSTQAVTTQSPGPYGGTPAPDVIGIGISGAFLVGGFALYLARGRRP